MNEAMNTIYAVYESEYDRPTAHFTTRAVAEDYRDRMSGPEITEIEEITVSDRGAPLGLLLYHVDVSRDGCAYHRDVGSGFPEERHEIETSTLHFAGQGPVKTMNVYVRAANRAEAIEKAQAVAESEGFIDDTPTALDMRPLPQFDKSIEVEWTRADRESDQT